MPRNNTWRSFSHNKTQSKQKLDGARKTFSPEYERPLSEKKAPTCALVGSFCPNLSTLDSRLWTLS